MSGPLNGVRVLELARNPGGPWAGSSSPISAPTDERVERKGAGDDTRAWASLCTKRPTQPSGLCIFPCHQSRASARSSSTSSRRKASAS